jgi:hypothetical protein
VGLLGVEDADQENSEAEISVDAATSAATHIFASTSQSLSSNVCSFSTLPPEFSKGAIGHINPFNVHCGT